MKRFMRVSTLLVLIACSVVGCGFFLGTGASAQGGLSNQVLQLLTRTNSWTGTNTFYDLRLPLVAVPSVTAGRLYTDGAGVLYWNGSTVTGGGGGGTTPHNLLSSTHPDTATSSATRGAVIVANAAPVWAKVQPSVTGSFLTFNGTDTVFSTDGSGLAILTAASLTGALPAISGASLTALNATNLGSGTVPLARLSGITNTQIDPAAAIAYSKLNLTGLVNLSSDTAATALPLAKGGTGLTAAADDTVPVSSGAAWVAATLPDCHDTTHALAYAQGTNSFSCQAIAGAGGGAVTSVDMSVPAALLSVSGNPITTSGTLAVSLVSQTQNLMFASPNGGSGTPTFRAMVNADLPLSGASANTYTKVTVNTRGVITSGVTQIAGATDISGSVAVGSGGTGLTTYTTGDMIYASGAGTLARLAAVATGHPLISQGVGVAPIFMNLTLTGTGGSTVAFGTGGTVQYTSTPTPLGTGTSVSLTAPRQYYVCTSTCTVTPPVPAAGYEFCVMNGNNVATVITLAALGSSARYENTARGAYGTAGTGTLVSTGAVGDKACILGLDATHYLTPSYTGTWTAS